MQTEMIGSNAGILWNVLNAQDDNKMEIAKNGNKRRNVTNNI